MPQLGVSIGSGDGFDGKLRNHAIGEIDPVARARLINALADKPAKLEEKRSHQAKVVNKTMYLQPGSVSYKVFKYLLSHGPATRNKVALECGLNPKLYSLRPTFSSLMRRGYIERVSITSRGYQKGAHRAAGEVVYRVPLGVVFGQDRRHNGRTNDIYNVLADHPEGLLLGEICELCKGVSYDSVNAAIQQLKKNGRVKGTPVVQPGVRVSKMKWSVKV